MDDFLLKNMRTTDIPMASPHFEVSDMGISQELTDSIDEMNRQKYEARQAQIDAAEDIAEIREHTAGIIDNQKHLIESQRELIDIQKASMEQLKSLNETQKQQLQRLKEIFYSVEDGTAVNKEVMKELEKILEQQPGWKDFIKDKGADAVVGGVLATLSQLLMKYGIML